MKKGSRERLLALDYAKGFAIFLVVFGHLVAGDRPEGNEWYRTLQHLVYAFHMPLFMFLSGAAFYYSYRPVADAKSYWQYVSKRAARLLPGFFLFSVLILGAKEAARHFLHVDNLYTTGAEALLGIVLHPGASVAKSLWYVFVLMQFCIFFPLLITVARGNLRVVLLVSAAIHGATLFVDITKMFALDQFCEYTLYFALGIVFIENRERWIPWISNHVIFCMSVFSMSFLALQVVDWTAAKTIIGLASIPAVYGLAASVRGDADRRILSLLSEYTYTIYLMNTLFIGLTKGVLLKAMPWDGVRFLVFFPVLLMAGLFGPVLMHRLVLVRFGPLARMTK